ncbi:hypothetical protein WJX72_001962 [[Myrmecia] bisecta]|uniref:DNA 3'-5' helicase n=1 Tax=[Myrmecia] bisecta TaxID=41462 RepID=A0AAW1QPE8_9CHLO
MVRQRSETPLWAAWLVFSVVGLPLDHVSAKHLSPIPDNCLTQYETQPWWNVDVKEYGRLAKYSGRLLQTETSVPKQQQAERLFEYSTALTEQMLRRGVSTLGDASRLRRAMHKLVSGQPVGVTVIGGSVSEGGGVWLTARSTDSYVGRIFSWIKSTFPGAKHRLHNGAIGGVASLYFAQCVDDFVPDEDVDLVIVEFTVNDRMVGLSGKAPEPDTSDRRGFEVLLRKLLSFKNRPAVLILHHWSVYVNAPNFFDSLEDVVNIVVQYYGLPALSFRNALYHSMMANVEGYQHQQVYCDAVHPNKLGHRYLADLVIGFLQDAAAEVLQKPLTDEDEQAALQPLPVPMYEGNLESSSSCLKANNFKTIVQDPVGWDWVDEGRDGRHKWGPLQLEAIQATLAKRDSLLLLPTGGGKSVTFQLPPLSQEFAFTVVVSPLLALAKDQVQGCLERDIEAELWNSQVADSKRRLILSQLHSDQPSLKLLYMTPEALTRTPELRDALSAACGNKTLFAFAIDEAHCVTTWGHDFRSAYLTLDSLHSDFPGVPVAALTATATPQVQADIIKALVLRNPVVIKGSFNRSNLQYQIRHKELLINSPAEEEQEEDACGDQSAADKAALQDLVAFIRRQEGASGIVYARLRATCDWLAGELQNADLDASAYHAGRDADTRSRVQRNWSEGSLEVVVATIAFGMGIDKADVRWVVHWNAPSSLEGFYQESGRAGRDGQPSMSILYASKDDLAQLQRLEKGARAGNVAAVAAYALHPACRRKALLSHFHEKRAACNPAVELPCDFCQHPKTVVKQLTDLESRLEAMAAEAAAAEADAAKAAEREECDDADGDGSPSAITTASLQQHVTPGVKGKPGPAASSGATAAAGPGCPLSQPQRTLVKPVIKRRKPSAAFVAPRLAVPRDQSGDLCISGQCRSSGVAGHRKGFVPPLKDRNMPEP